MKNKNVNKIDQISSPSKSQMYTHSTLITNPTNIEGFHNQFIQDQISTQNLKKSRQNSSNFNSNFQSQKSLNNIIVHHTDSKLQLPKYKNSRVYKTITQINQNLTSQIQQGVTRISQNRQQVSQIFLQYLSKEDLQKILKKKQQKKIKQLLKMKQEALQKLDKVYEQQAKIRMNRVYRIHSNLGDYTRFVTQASQNKPSSKSIQKRERSYFSPQQKKKIKQILKTKDQKPLMNQKKVQQLLNSLNSQKQQQLIEQKLKIERLKQQHRKQVEQHFKKKQLQKKQKQIFKQKYQSHPNKLKIQDYTHIKYQKTDLMREKEKLKMQQIILQRQRDQKKFDIDEIKQHQKKYESIMMEKKAQLQKRAKSRISIIQHQKKNYEITKIKQILALQDQQNVQKVQQTKALRLQYHKKLKQYDAYIKQNHQPKTNQNSKFQPKRRISIQGLSQEERIRQGNRYLEYAKLLKKNSNVAHSRSEIDNESNNSIGKLTQYQQKKTKKQKYPNYLKFVKELNQKNKTSQNEEEQELMRILKNQNSSLVQIKKAVSIANKLNLNSVPNKQKNSRKGSFRIKTESDYQNAKAKLLLLNGIMSVDKQE